MHLRRIRAMKQNSNRNRIILSRAFGLLALPVTLSAAVGMTRLQAPDVIDAQTGAAITYSAVEEAQRSSIAEAAFQSDWGAANPSVYARIALAFDTETMSGADLTRVECRSSVCKVFYEADSDINVKKVLPRELAETFQRMVAVHGGKTVDDETLIYIDIPDRG